MRKLFILFIVFIGVTGCASNEVGNSGDVQQNTIHQRYSIEYDEEQNRTDIKATFRFGGGNGTTLVLTNPSNITFNGENMILYKSDLSGAWYSKAFNSPLANGGMCTFIFTDTKGKKYTNAVKFNALLLGQVPAKVAKGMPLEVAMVSAPLEFGEKIIVSLTDSVNNEEFILEQVPQNKTLVVPATIIGKLKGRVILSAWRSKTIKLQEANQEGGELSYIYTLKNREFIVE